jgi:hypothetical protein
MLRLKGKAEARLERAVRVRRVVFMLGEAIRSSGGTVGVDVVGGVDGAVCGTPSRFIYPAGYVSKSMLCLCCPVGRKAFPAFPKLPIIKEMSASLLPVW